MKPNGEELASLTGGDAEAIEADPAAAAQRRRACWSTAASSAVLATLGGSGAVLVTAEGAWHADPAARPPSSAPSAPATPACSATCSATCAALGPAERLRLAVAYGSAAAGLPGTTIPHPDHTRPDLVEVRPSSSPSPPGCPHRELRKR